MTLCYKGCCRKKRNTGKYIEINRYFGLDLLEAVTSFAGVIYFILHFFCKINSIKYIEKLFYIFFCIYFFYYLGFGLVKLFIISPLIRGILVSSIAVIRKMIKYCGFLIILNILFIILSYGVFNEIEIKGCYSNNNILLNEVQCSEEENSEIRVFFSFENIYRSFMTVIKLSIGRSMATFTEITLNSKIIINNFFYWFLLIGFFLAVYLIFEAFFVGISSAINIDILTKEYIHLVDDNVSPELQEWYEVQKAFSETKLKVLKHTRHPGKYNWIFIFINSEIGNFSLNILTLIMYITYLVM